MRAFFIAFMLLLFGHQNNAHALWVCTKIVSGKLTNFRVDEDTGCKLDGSVLYANDCSPLLNPPAGADRCQLRVVYLTGPVTNKYGVQTYQAPLTGSGGKLPTGSRVTDTTETSEPATTAAADAAAKAALEAAQQEAIRKAAEDKAAQEAARKAAEAAAAEDAARKAAELAAQLKTEADQTAALEAERKALAAKESADRAAAENRSAQIAAEEAAAERATAAEKANELANKAVEAEANAPKNMRLAVEEQEAAEKEAVQLQAMMGQLKQQNKMAAAYYGGAKAANMGGISQRVHAGVNNSNNDSSLSGDLQNAELEAGSKINRGLASDLSNSDRLRIGAMESDTDSSGQSSEDESYQAYMTDMAHGQMVDELRNSKDLRDQLRKRISGMLTSGSPEEVAKARESLIPLLAEAEGNGPNKNVSDIRPLSTREAFAMDAEETSRGVRGLLDEFDRGQSDNGLTRTESLFDRVKSTHDRSLKNGLVRLENLRSAK